MKNLDLLIPTTVDQNTSYWATVTQTSPLRIKLDGESSALPFTPDTLVANLQVNDRVRVEFATNNDPSFRGRRAIVTGRAGGQALVLPDNSVTNAKMADNSVNTAELVSGSVTSAKLADSAYPNAEFARTVGFSVNHTSTSYTTVSGISVTINKQRTNTRLRIEVGGSWFFTVGGGVVAVRVASTDHEIDRLVPANALNQRLKFGGVVFVAGLGTGNQTVTLRVRAFDSPGGVRMDANDYAFIDVIEVAP